MILINLPRWHSVIFDTKTFEIWVSDRPAPCPPSSKISFRSLRGAYVDRDQISPNPTALKSHQHQLYVGKRARDTFIRICEGQSVHFVDGASWIADCRKNQSLWNPGYFIEGYNKVTKKIADVAVTSVPWIQNATTSQALWVWNTIGDRLMWGDLGDFVMIEAIQWVCKGIFDQVVLSPKQNMEDSWGWMAIVADESIGFIVKDVALKSWLTPQWTGRFGQLSGAIAEQIAGDLCVWVLRMVLPGDAGEVRVDFLTEAIIMVVTQGTLHEIAKCIFSRRGRGRWSIWLTAPLRVGLLWLLRAGLHWLLN